jgi:hypothetical protein
MQEMQYEKFTWILIRQNMIQEILIKSQSCLNWKCPPNYDPSGGRITFSYIATFCVLFLIIAIIKSPTIFIDPRFWAEEGSEFFTKFLQWPFYECITYIKAGSWQGWTNAVVYLATQVPAAYAPAVTTYFSLAFDLAIVAQIAVLTRTHDLKPAIGLLLVAVWAMLPSRYEVWLNATNLQWIAGVSVLLVLAAPSAWIERHWRGAAMWSAFCGLAGVPGTLLAPVFVLRGGLERSRRIAVIGLAEGATALLQLAVLITHPQARPYPDDPLTLLLPFFLQSVLAPLLSGDLIARISYRISSNGTILSPIISIGTISLGSIILILATRAAYTGREKFIALVLLLGIVLVSEIQNFGSINPQGNIGGWGGGRYFLCGSVGFCLILALGTSARATSLKILSTGLLCTIVMVGVYTRVASPWPQGMVQGPSWRRQLAACPAGQTCRIQIWPRGQQWFAELRKD